MPIYGPWITPPAENITHPPSLTFFAGVNLTGTSYATLCESTFDSPAVSTTANSATWVVNDPLQYEVGQVAFDMDTAGVLPTSWNPPLPWPSGAVAFEETGRITLTGLHVDVGVQDSPVNVTLRESCTLFLTTNAPGDLPYDPSNGGLPGTHFIPGVSVIERAAVAYPTSVTAATLSADVPISHIAPAYPGTGRQVIQLVVGVDQQVTHTAPTFTAGQAVGRSWKFTSVVATYTYQPPTYRFVYDARPPLAHRQRRDGTATTGPQLAHIGTTGGRPPLAWRQNNP